MKEGIKNAVTTLIGILCSGVKGTFAKWSVVIALAALIAALLTSCASQYKSIQSCVKGGDTVVMEHTIEGRIRK